MEIVPLWGDLFGGDPIPVNGKIRPPDRPGWGITLNHDRVSRIEVRPERSTRRL